MKIQSLLCMAVVAATALLSSSCASTGADEDYSYYSKYGVTFRVDDPQQIVR